MGTISAFSGTSIGKNFKKHFFVWEIEETCAGPYNAPSENEHFRDLVRFKFRVQSPLYRLQPRLELIVVAR